MDGPLMPLGRLLRGEFHTQTAAADEMADCRPEARRLYRMLLDAGAPQR